MKHTYVRFVDDRVKHTADSLQCAAFSMIRHWMLHRKSVVDSVIDSSHGAITPMTAQFARQEGAQMKEFQAELSLEQLHIIISSLGFLDLSIALILDQEGCPSSRLLVGCKKSYKLTLDADRSSSCRPHTWIQRKSTIRSSKLA